ncbi:hypothetical protein [Arthrobacter sp. SAFR-014]|uniref:hypothetical protein n=1 Tax=unclassified Arthrobacter TaxID=235627 RepID=UPI003F7C4EC1
MKIVGILGVQGEHLFPRSLVKDQLKSPSARLARLARYPAELVVTDLADLDAVIG